MQTFEFNNIWDGTKEGAVTKRGDMTRLQPDKLFNNDLVLIECQVNRFIQGNRKPTFTISRGWETRFRLVSIVKLYEPDGVDFEEESADESEIREESDSGGEAF